MARISFTPGVKALSPDSEVVERGVYAATILSAVDTDLAAGNIKETVNIFGKVGTVAALSDISVSDTLFNSNDGSKTTTDLGYIKVKEVELHGQGGSIRIKFDLGSGYAPGGKPGYGRIYKNGNPIGTERSEDGTTYVTFSEDIAGWSDGDLIQLYIHGSGGQIGKIQNFRLYGDDAIWVENTLE